MKKHKEKAEKLDLYLDEKAKIESAIEKLKITSEDLKDEKENFKRARTNFTMYSTFAFTTSLTALVLTALYFYFNRYYIDTSSLNLTYYLFCVFPILFPSVIGFLFVRQANVNSIEISKINKRFVLIHEVNQSLQALVEINRGKDMDDKTERVIDKLIDNILADTTGTPIQNNEIELNASQMDELLNKIYESIKNKADIVKDVSGA